MKPLFWLTNKGREHRLRWIAALLLSILFVVSAAEAGAAVERGGGISGGLSNYHTA